MVRDDRMRQMHTRIAFIVNNSISVGVKLVSIFHSFQHLICKLLMLCHRWINKPQARLLLRMLCLLSLRNLYKFEAQICKEGPSILRYLVCSSYSLSSRDLRQGFPYHVELLLWMI